MNDNNTHDDRFDAAMRERHAAAVTAVSARTQARLQPRRRVAPAMQAARAPIFQRFGWPAMASFAAVLALLIGLQMQHDPAPAPATPTVAAVDGNLDGLDTVLDENPDFYLWLASRDANAIAME